jgi:hypothetical protein
MPTVKMPTVKMPTVKMPTVKMPTVKMPTVKMSTMSSCRQCHHVDNIIMAIGNWQLAKMSNYQPFNLLNVDLLAWPHPIGLYSFSDKPFLRGLCTEVRLGAYFMVDKLLTQLINHEMGHLCNLKKLPRACLSLLKDCLDDSPDCPPQVLGDEPQLAQLG